MLLKAYNNILIVIKQTPYQQYLQLKAQGKAPVALRWERLENRDIAHRSCVDNVIKIIDKIGIKYTKISREELYRGSLQEKDLVIAVGGDGTVLNTSSFIDDTIPVLGINSDPSKPEENKANHKKDERRSRGAICAISAFNLEDNLAKILYGNISPGLRTRIQCIVRSTYTETKLPPALNDILVCNPSPAAVSRFRLHFCKSNDDFQYNSPSSSSSTILPSSISSSSIHSSSSSLSEQELFSFNVWSSGIWISTPTGSTAAMHAAGGNIMDIRSRNLQYMVREHLIEDGTSPHLKQAGHSIIRPNELLKLRWNSQFGEAFVDGSHFKHSLALGDELRFDAHAPFLKIFDPI